MPSNYAHYRFGCAMLAQMPPDVRRTVNRFRQLYDMGLHGPDLFLYYNPVVKNAVSSQSKRWHRLTGSEFFTRACRLLRLERNEAGIAYLYGILCHYCLDSQCHPYIRDNTGDIAHTRLETEFDRFLLESDGKTPPWACDLSPHMRLTPGECETVAKFYPGTTAGQVRACVRNMATITKTLASPIGPGRELARKIAAIGGSNVAGAVMDRQPDPRCTPLLPDLQKLYDAACQRFPRMLNQLCAHMAHGAMFDEEFAPDFG